jgi:probable F420-dependent oxidoreductase
MRLGFCLPQYGPDAGPEALVAVAQRAETLGFESLWVSERLLWPLDPRTPYPASPDGRLPEQARCQLDPLESLTFVAARTRTARLGTSVVNLPFHNPLVLARRFASLDVLSGGRACVGLGNGWSADEFEAAGVPARGRGRRIDEALAILKAVWTTDPVEFEGEHFRIPRSFVQPKPVQKPHPPIYYAAFAPAAMRRVALEADGWNPAGLPVGAMGSMFQSMREMAERAGRDPGALTLVVRANVWIGKRPLSDPRAVFTGDADQIAADIAATRDLGADELFFDAQPSRNVNSIDDLLAAGEQLLELAHRG